MKRSFTILTAALALLACLAIPMGMMGQTTTLVSGSGTSGYSIPDGWTSSGTVEGGSYLKFDGGTITSPEFAPHNGLSFTYSVATFGSGTNHPLTIRILNASTNAVISEMTTATPTSSSYINTESPLSLGDVTVAFKIQMYGPTGKGVRLRNYSVTGTPAGGQQLTPSDLALVNAPVELEFDLYDNANAQTISYTTSSTGAVTVSQSEYVTTSVSGNTITVTPVAVTNGPQTITVNQAADNTYAAGSVTFTVDIEDSTPSTSTDVTFLAGTDLGSTSSNNSPDEMEKNGVTVSSTDAAFATAQYRLYQSSVTTISVESGTITNIVFNGQSTSYPVSRLSVNGNNGSYTVSNNVGTWTGNTNEVSFSASGQARLSSIVVTVETSGTPDPTISANNVDLAYSATTGFITYTINNEPSPAGTLTAAVTNGNWLTLEQGTTSPIAFTCTANENTTARTATVTLTYNYGTNQTVTANVTVTQAAAPVSYTTIPALYAAATTTETSVLVTFNDWVVSGVSTNGKSVYVTDNSGNGFIIYFTSDMSSTFAAGNILSGTAVSCKLKLYNGAAELVDLDASDLTITTGGTVSTSNIALADLAGVNTGALVHYDNLTCSVDDSGNTTKYYLSDGTTTIQVYNTLYAFDALTAGERYNITGVYVQYNSTKEIAPRSAADIYEIPHVLYTLTVSSLTNVEMSTFVGDNSQATITNTGSAQVYDGTVVRLNVAPVSGYMLESLMVDGAEHKDDIIGGTYTFTMPTHPVTVTATAVVPPCYTVTLCDNNTELTEQSYGAGVTLPSRSGNSTWTFAGWSTINVGAETTTPPATIIHAGSYQPTMNIVLYPVYTRTEGGSGTEWHLLNSLSEADAGVYALLTENYYAFDGTISNQGHGGATSGCFTFNNDGVATSAPTGTLEMTFEAVEESGVVVGYKMYSESNGYLYAKKAASGNLAWISTDNQYWSCQQQQSGNWCYSQNNAYLRSYSDNSFRTYGNNSGHLLQLAKKVGGSGTTYYTSLLSICVLEDVIGYGVNYNPETDANEHWYLIASPMVGGSNPMSVQRLINTAGYDLYRFDQAEELEWRNYKNEEFDLELGHGYLYANSESGDITFVGTPNTGTTFSVTLDKGGNDDSNMNGWNLVGNPFTVDAYITKPFYKMNPDGNAILSTSTSGPIAPMEGVFVMASSNGETLTFTKEPQGKNASLSLNVTKGRSVIDRAIVSFGESELLPKFQFRDGSTKVYIPMDGKDYAVVSADGVGEMPVNFKAEENGRYTITVNPEGVEFNYLHLIDNMTGANIDLLVNPSYSFEARTTDYASRFRLVFSATGIEENSANEAFAYFNGTEWMVNNEGEANLQLIDLTGRVISSETINGTVAKAINATPGIYMLRLMNNNEVKTQKILVK